MRRPHKGRDVVECQTSPTVLENVMNIFLFSSTDDFGNVLYWPSAFNQWLCSTNIVEWCHGHLVILSELNTCTNWMSHHQTQSWWHKAHWIKALYPSTLNVVLMTSLSSKNNKNQAEGAWHLVTLTRPSVMKKTKQRKLIWFFTSPMPQQTQQAAGNEEGAQEEVGLDWPRIRSDDADWFLSLW